ncbi:hypothetical protein [Nocardia abscessus]|uniref:hypothetical protein n=1 Tax=Nocardia abscessus TaxID=120957 RepID=UPI001E40AF23|nr:hypothetical protein [Nocardia abscessus]
MLLCGDLMTQMGNGPALTTSDLVEQAGAAEDVFHATSLGPAVPATLNRLAELAPTTLAIMHGSSFAGDGGYGTARSRTGLPGPAGRLKLRVRIHGGLRRHGRRAARTRR